MVEFPEMESSPHFQSISSEMAAPSSGSIERSIGSEDRLEEKIQEWKSGSGKSKNNKIDDFPIKFWF